MVLLLASLLLRRLLAFGDMKALLRHSRSFRYSWYLVGPLRGSLRPIENETADLRVPDLSRPVPGISQAVDRAPEPKDPDLSWPFPGARQARDRAAAQSKWKKNHNVSDRQWEEMIANYKARKLPKSVTETGWWEEAKDKRPAELNRLYPPLQPREWYQAEWSDGFSQSELDLT